MTRDEDFNLLKIQTFILKVNIHCDGCKQEARKLLQRTEGVYTVRIDGDHQKVTVSGNVDSATLIKKLARAGKHAELWTQKSNNHNQNSKPKQQHNQPGHLLKDCNKNNSNNAQAQANQTLMQGLQAFKNQHCKLGDPLTSEDEDSEDDGLGGDEEEFKLLREKMNQINMLRQANSAAAAAAALASKKNGTAAVNGSDNSNKNSDNNPNQNQGLRSPNGSDQIGFNSAAASNKMVGGGNFSGGNFSGVMSGLEGFGHGGLGFQQHQSGLFPAGSYPSSNVPSPSPMMMNLQGYQYQNPASSMMMKSVRGGGGLNNNNLMMHESRYMQPQVMYNRAPQIPSYTGYYCYQACPPSPYLINQHQQQQQQQPGASGGEFGAHLFSDENTNSCVVM